MPRDDLLLTEIVDSITRILALVARMDPDDLASDRDLVDALLWNYTVLGEATNGLSDNVKSMNSSVSWADPVRLRNRIVHGYWSIELDVLVSTANQDLPKLLKAVQRVRADR